MTVGCNRFTPQKWDRLRYLLKVHSNMVASITARNRWALPEYHYFDAYAGPGFYSTECSDLFGDYGSPVIAANVLRKKPHKLFLKDSDPACLTQLASTLTIEHAPALMTCCDVAEFAAVICQETWRRRQFGTTTRKAMGLFFADPNGCLSWDSVACVASTPQYDRLDLLLNINATAIKRCRTAMGGKYRSLCDELPRLNKRYLYIWAPHRSNAWQFALVFATNWCEFPEFARSKFWRSDTPEGAALLTNLDRTIKERGAA